MNTVDISLDNVEPPSPVLIIEKICLRILDMLSKNRVELSVLLCGDDRIRNLNRNYRNKDTATDVLSFPQIETDCEKEQFVTCDAAAGEASPENAAQPAGDIVISIETLKKNAARFGVSEIDEMKRLLVHGILHLFGMEHDENNPDDRMLSIQDKIIEDLSKEKMF